MPCLPVSDLYESRVPFCASTDRDDHMSQFTVRAVDDLDEACKLLEVGFEYVCDLEEKKLFRKRK